LADEQDYPAATQTLLHALQSLPPEAPWAAQGAAKLRALVDSLANRRVDEKAKVLAEFEKGWRQNSAANAPPSPRLTALLAHRDPLFRQEITALQARLEEEGRARQAQRQQQESALRTAWLDFFARFTSSVAEGDLDAAEKLCKPGAWDPVLKGGVADPQAVLNGCAADIAAIRKLQDLALNVARESKRSVSFSMRRGRVEGTLDGVEGRTLQIALGGGARVGVKIEQMTAGGFTTILDQKVLAAANLQQAIWALSACENPADAASFLPKAYANARLPLPLHWQERLRLEKFRKLNEEAVKLLRELDAASLNGDPEKVKAALEAVRPVLTALEEFGPLDEARRGSLNQAAKLVGKAVSARVVLQTGALPTADYTGLTTDQISQYRESMQRTDVGVQYGLKVGAAGGVQRVLLKFDGLEAALGKARVKRATLDLYQIDSPQAVNAVVGLFRLKRPWVPDSGTWMSYDNAKNGNWSLPGASADADAESKEDAKVTLDNRKNVWRSWDVTAYVQDVLAGKAQNYGFLLRVVNGEPDYHVRFYPETDLEALKDKALRPRLVLEVEQD
ncbi:MAG: DNRLRE domain-containing protein, partial [Planctomycetota bacterium]|nr:DNRLRE domain-containing protein [Planctomycetota bacterium]